MCEGLIAGVNTSRYRVDLTGSSWSDTTYTIKPVPHYLESVESFDALGNALQQLYPEGVSGGDSVTGSDWWCLPDGCYEAVMTYNQSGPVAGGNSSVYARLEMIEQDTRSRSRMRWTVLEASSNTIRRRPETRWRRR